MTATTIEIYDTTLRDGSQQEGISLSVSDKLRIAGLLDDLGVAYIEGGWPGALPKDDQFFRRARTELDLSAATLVAFGSTRRPRIDVASDPQLRALLDAETEVICIVGKAWDYHVTEALRTDLDEAVRMVAESIEYLRRHGRRVFFDAEHFFDGYRSNPATRSRPSSGPCARRWTGSDSGSTSTTTPAARWPPPWRRSEPALPRCRAV